MAHDDNAAAAAPSYSELPLNEVLKARYSWKYFGSDDELGTLNWITDEKVRTSLSEARSGTRINLTIEASEIAPPLYGRNALVHTYLENDRNTWDDKLDEFYPQAGSQWDGLRHIRAREFGFFGGRTASPPDLGSELGMQAWATRGIVSRGVLLDVERYLTATGVDYDPMVEYSVGPEVLAATALSQGVEILPGDILCVRFGWMAAYRQFDVAQRANLGSDEGWPAFAGLAAGEPTVEALWNWKVAAVACDNPGAEVAPGSAAVGSLHRRLLPLLGFAIGELFDFDELAEASAADGRWSFLLVSVPLNVSGAIGSPANAIAIR
jgi:kynurenine formamidase